MTSTASFDLPPVNPPPRHYGPDRFGIECIAVTRLMAFSPGNAVKYLWRHNEKGGWDDLRKCVDYLGWTAADVARGGSVWIGAAERIAGTMLLDQWVRPRLTPDMVEYAILMVATEDLGHALELVNAAMIGGRS